jgi:uncharacterized protein YndB with AHSA1/START domain
VNVSRGAAPCERSTDHDRAQVVQAPRPGADAEDRRELHRGAGKPPSGSGAEGERCTRARDLGREDPAEDRRGWEEWFELLDQWGAAERTHREIARWVAAQQGVEPLAWNAQAVAGSYELARGLRVVGEKPDGFAITASKTVAVPVERLYDAVVDESLRLRWLPDDELHERTATRPRSARFEWGDSETRVNVTFLAKGEARSTVALEHRRLADADEAERMKAYWRQRIGTLKEVLER